MNSLSRLQRLDLHSLRLFATVVKDGSITRAAERNHIAASALSRRVADLEHAVGAPLLLRSRKGVIVTDAGRTVARHVERIQDELISLLDAVAIQESRPVRICASHSVIAGALPELMRAFELSSEQVRLEISEGNSREVLAACAEGTADIGIGLGIQGQHPETVEVWSLWTDRLQVVMREDHFLARCKAVRFEQVLAFPVIGSAPEGALFALLQQQAAQIGASLALSATAADFSTACQLAESGLGLAIVPGTSIPAGLSKTLTRRPLFETWSQRPVNLYCNAKQQRAAGCAALLRHLKMQAQLRSTIRQERDGVFPAPRFEPQFTEMAVLPIAREASA